jgi:hypothetical protein
LVLGDPEAAVMVDSRLLAIARTSKRVKWTRKRKKRMLWEEPKQRDWGDHW